MSAPITDLDLENAAVTGKTLEIRGFTLTPKLQNSMERVLRILLIHYDQSGHFPVVYAVVQELALWASLANMRQVYFEEHGLDLGDDGQLNANEADFRGSLSPSSVFDYRRKIRERGLFLAIRIVHGAPGIRFEIMNNAVHNEALEERLRSGLRQAMTYSDIMEYFRDHPEDDIGRDVGLAFSIQMLREQNLRPELMRLGQKDGGQVSRLEIPFDSSFESIRDRILNDEVITPFGTHSLIPPDVEVAEMTTVVCPICENIVDERIFFQDLDAGMIDEESVRSLRPHWSIGDGACASCIASHDPRRVSAG